MSTIQTATVAAIETRMAVALSPKAGAAQPRAGYSVAIGYLRAFVTVLVLAHHAVLAYVPFAAAVPVSLAAQPRIWQAFPVVDAQKWGGFGLFTSFNDIFFMSLMFFVSGLFVWKGLERKGSGTFLRDRMLRLGVPFVAAAAIIAPLAYYPTYLQMGRRGLAGYYREWSALGTWPAGPAWFVWVLLAFDCVAAALFAMIPRWGEAFGGFLTRAARRPAVFFGILVAASAAAYIPMALVFNPFVWVEFGPFFFQTSRILHYLVYFLTGAAVGACGTEGGLFAPDGKLARRWPLWCVAAVIFFGAAIAVFLAAIAAQNSPYKWGTVGGVTFALSCGASCLASLALFVRFARKPRRIFDSLRDNAYGMYLVHYPFASWLQLALLNANLPGAAKGIIVIIGTVALSWGATAALRRIPAVARVI